jgi:cytochrome P450
LHIIDKRRSEHHHSHKEEDNDILNLLLKGSKMENEEVQGMQPLDDRELISNSFIMIVAGHETTSRALTMALYLLSKNSHIQEEAYQSITTNIPDFDQRELTYEDYSSKLEYLHWIFDETLRLYPIAVGIARELQQEVTFKEHVLPKGTIALYSWMTAFKDEKYFKNPNDFVPSRWQDSELSKSLMYSPFGGKYPC